MHGVIVAVLLLSQAGAPPTYAPASAAKVRAFEHSLQQARRRLAAAGPSESVAGELARREAMYQAGQAALAELRRDGDSSVTVIFPARVLDALQAIDTENIAYLRSVLPADGWFRKSRDGAAATSNAWLLLQHSGDAALMSEVARRIEPLVRLGEVDGNDFALLYDRAEVFQRRPQRFGSQITCVEGKVALYPMEDAAGVDARRTTLGLPSMAENAKRFPNLGQPCTGDAPLPD